MRITFKITYYYDVPFVQDYKSYDFGSVTMGPIHLSEIDSKGEDGYYLPVTIIETN